MGGSGGRGFFRGRKPEEIKLDLRKEEEKTLDQAFDAQVAEPACALCRKVEDARSGFDQLFLHQAFGHLYSKPAGEMVITGATGPYRDVRLADRRLAACRDQGSKGLHGIGDLGS